MLSLREKDIDLINEDFKFTIGDETLFYRYCRNHPRCIIA